MRPVTGRAARGSDPANDPGFDVPGAGLPAGFAEFRLGDGPIIATAIHAGHQIRAELRPWLAADEATRRRDEDPLTDVLASTADTVICARHSRFEVDLNRSRDEALGFSPEDTWGVRIWREPAPDEAVRQSLARHQAFYRAVTQTIEAALQRHRALLLLDVHSYNHRRDGPDAPVADPAGNPDIDLGVTELNPDVWGGLIDRFADALRAVPIGERRPDVRCNVRYPDGGHFPEWLYRTFDDRVCVVTLEYKKIFVDEWSGIADLSILERLRAGLAHAIEVARPELVSPNV